MAELIHEVEPESTAEVAPQYTPTVYLEVSKEQLELLSVGDTVTAKLTGKIKSLNANEQDKANDRYEINMELKSVVLDPKENEFSRLAEDD